MSVELIKQYLVGIGFQVDEGSVNKTEKSMDRADKKVKEFNKEKPDLKIKESEESNNKTKEKIEGSKKDDSKPKVIDNKKNKQDNVKPQVIDNKENDSIVEVKNPKKAKKKQKKNLDLKENIKSKSKNPKEELPQITENKTAKKKKSEKKSSESEVPKVKTGNKETVEKVKREVHEVNKVEVIKTEKIKESPKKDKIKVHKVETPKIDIPDIADKVKSQIGPGDIIKGFVGVLGGLQGATSSLLTGSGTAISKFASSVLGPIGLLVTVTAAALRTVEKLTSSLNKMANKDIEYEKLSRQLWTTKEDAKDVDSALKTLGASMEDLHASFIRCCFRV